MGIAMPMKYIYGNPLAVKYVGWVHGLLFVVYVALLAILSSEHNWPKRRTAFGFLGAVLPFGTFIFDRYLMKQPHETV